MSIKSTKLYPALGQNTDGSPTQKAVADGLNGLQLKVNTTTLVPAGGTPASYPNFAQAQTPAVSGDTIYTTGYQGADLRFEKDGVVYDCTGMTTGTNSILVLPYRGRDTSTSLITKRITSAGKVTIVRQQAAASATLYDTILEGAGRVEMYGLEASDNTKTTATLINTTSRRTVATPATNLNTSTNGCIFYQGYDTQGQLMDLILDGGNLSSTIGPIFTGYLNPACRIYLRGNLVLNPAPGFPVAQFIKVSDGSVIDPATIIVDQRTNIVALPPVSDSVRATILGYDNSHWTNATLNDPQPSPFAKWKGDSVDGTYTYEFVEGKVVRTQIFG